jgi:CubicO group peptidase (beta-lactamase class C family)
MSGAFVLALAAAAIRLVAAAQPSPLPAPARSAQQAQPAQPARPAQPTLCEALEALRARHDVPALAAARLAEAAIAESAAVGVRRVGGHERVSVTDRFHLGSCGKPMTATLAARLEQRGLLRHESTVADLLPELKETMAAGWKDVTVRHLLDHRSGLPAHTTTGHDATRDLDPSEPPRSLRARFAAALVALPLAAAPGAVRAYSNAGYWLVGALVERAADLPFEGLLRRELLEPIGMVHAGFGPPARDARDPQPWGHSFLLKFRIADDPRAPASAHPPWYAPAGDLRASIEEWARFAALHLGAPPPTDAVVPWPGAEALAALHLPAPGAASACGFSVTTRPWASGPVLAHHGSSKGWHCLLALSPADRSGFLVACNQGGDPAQRACEETIELLVGRTLPPASRDRK